MTDSSKLGAFQTGFRLAPLLDRTLIQVRGQDRLTFLHNLCTNDVKGLAPDQGCEAFFTNVQGKTICHALLLAMEDEIWISTDAGIGEKLLPHLDKYLIREDVELVDQTNQMLTYFVGGADAEKWLAIQHDSPLTKMLGHSRVSTADSAQEKKLKEGPKEFVVARVPYSAAPAFFALVPGTDEADWLQWMSSSGAESISAEALEFARIQAGFPCSGRDITEDNLPQEIGRDEVAISFTKGCYLGQETVARIDALGHVNKNLARLTFQSDTAAPRGAELRYQDKVVGTVTSSVDDPGHPPIGLGFVRRECLEKNLPLESDFGAVHVDQ